MRIEFKRNPWGRDEHDLVIRLHRVKKLNRLCLIDYTRARFYSERPAWRRLTILGCAIYEANAQLSGLPGRSGSRWSKPTLSLFGRLVN